MNCGGISLRPPRSAAGRAFAQAAHRQADAAAVGCCRGPCGAGGGAARDRPRPTDRVGTADPPGPRRCAPTFSRRRHRDRSVCPTRWRRPTRCPTGHPTPAAPPSRRRLRVAGARRRDHHAAALRSECAGDSDPAHRVARRDPHRQRLLHLDPSDRGGRNHADPRGFDIGRYAAIHRVLTGPVEGNIYIAGQQSRPADANLYAQRHRTILPDHLFVDAAS